MYQNRKQVVVSQKNCLLGLSLIEVVVAMGVFSLLMAVVSVAFSGGFVAYRNAASAQKYLENAQYIMNDLAKQLRTSSIIDPIGNPATNTSPASITFFDHSQSKCIAYRQHATSDYIEKSVGTAGTTALCGTAPGFSVWNRVTTGEVTMDLVIRNSVLNTRVGLVTISFFVGGGSTAAVSPILLQTSVSLRDYKTSFGL